MKIGIIGGLGIGMSHAIATEKNGNKVSFVCDANLEEIRSRYERDTWKNEWGDIVETVKNTSRPILIEPKDLVKNDELKSDIIVIATPDITHYNYISILNNIGIAPIVICEKPLDALSGTSYDYYKYMNDIILKGLGSNITVYIGHEWLSSKKVRDSLTTDKKIINIVQFHDYPPYIGVNTDSWKYGRSIIRDLGSHLISYALYYLNNPRVEDLEILLSFVGRDITTFTIHDKSVNNTVVCSAIYGFTSNNIYKISDFNLSRKMSIYDAELIIGGNPIAWEDDLFQKEQIDAFCRREWMVDLETGIKIDYIMNYLLK